MAVEGKQTPQMALKTKLLEKHASDTSADCSFKCCLAFIECPWLGQAYFWKVSM